MIDEQAVVAAYVSVALRTATDEDGNDLTDYEEYSIADLYPEVQQEIRDDVSGFVDMALETLGYDFDWEGKDAGQVGHDLYLTHARHGAGFWDGDWENGTVLTEIAQCSYPAHIEIQVDGRWYMA